MARSTDAQKSERLNAAHSLLARGMGMTEAVVSLSRQFGISRRQAYRYLQEARAIGHTVPVVAPSVPITPGFGIITRRTGWGWYVLVRSSVSMPSSQFSNPAGTCQ